MKTSDFPSKAQLRQELCERQQAARRSRYIEAAVSGPAEMTARLFPGDTSTVERVRAAVAERYDATPDDPGANIDQVSIHEAGHFAAAEAQGLTAGMAEIHGTPSGRYGWGGYAKAWERPVIDSGRWGFTADDVRSEAMLTLAGPLAEHMLATDGGQPRGDLYGALGEILEGCIVIAKLADMTGRARAATLREVLTHTTQLVCAFEEEISRLSFILRTRKKIYRCNRNVYKILIVIQNDPLKHMIPLTSEQAEKMELFISEAPLDLMQFTENVGDTVDPNCAKYLDDVP